MNQLKNFDIKVKRGHFTTYNYKPSFFFCEVKQVHGSTIVEATPKNFKELYQEESDGIILLYESWSNKMPPLAIKTADCLPILALGTKGITLIHAGWRGLHQKILQSNAIQKIDPEHFYFGPHITPKYYEVKKDFLKNFLNSKNILKNNSKYFFNLSGEASDQISQAFPRATIIKSKLCTYQNNLLHSYRLNQTNLRNFNLFIPE